MYVTGVTRIQSVVLCRIGGRGHLRSRDKDGGHTIRSAMAENSAIRKLHDSVFYRTGVIVDGTFYIAGIGNLAYFAKNSGKY